MFGYARKRWMDGNLSGPSERLRCVDSFTDNQLSLLPRCKILSGNIISKFMYSEVSIKPTAGNKSTAAKIHSKLDKFHEITGLKTGKLQIIILPYIATPLHVNLKGLKSYLVEKVCVPLEILVWN